MKNSVSHVLSFILMCLLSFLTVFIVIQLSLNTNNILNILKKVNYYDLTHKNILEKLDELIINREVNESYKEYFSIKMVKEDVKDILTGEDNISHYDDLYEIISKHSSDETIREKYSNEIDSIYKKNIFPIKEYNLINKIKLESDNTLFIFLIFIILILFISSFIFILNKNFKYYKISIISTSILLMLPLTLIKLLNIFNNFMYTNEYYTNFILGIINNIIDTLFLIGIIILGVYLIIYLIKSKKYLNLNKK